MADATRKRAPEVATKDSTTTETLEQSSRVEFELPGSKGDLAEARQPNAGDPERRSRTDQPGPRAPGRTMDNEEAAARMAGAGIGPEGAVRANELLGHLFEQGAAHGVRDEVDDATAARIAGQARGANHLGQRRREAVEARPVQQLEQRPRQVIEARPVQQIENLAEAPHDALVPMRPRARDEGLVPAVPPPPGTALAVQERLPAFVENDVHWLTIAQTPGYLEQMIRRFGREIFRGFPCFAEHERLARAAGHPDPLATIHLIANLGGRGRPSTTQELDTVASWIRQNGTVIRTEEMEFPFAMPGYRPEIVLLVSQDESFLLVRELVERGAPENSTYVYRWDGGVRPYLNARGQGLLERLAERPALGAPARPAAAGAPRQVEDLREQLAGAVSRPAPVARRARLAALPVAPTGVRTDSPLQKLLDIGFARHADADGPALMATAPDGTNFRVSALPGRRLIDGDVFRLKTLDSQGVEQLADLDVEEIQSRFADRFPHPGAP